MGSELGNERGDGQAAQRSPRSTGTSGEVSESFAGCVRLARLFFGKAAADHLGNRIHTDGDEIERKAGIRAGRMAYRAATLFH
ncbi:MAG: hypothetical protein ACI9OD_001012 [Limisphaerales bacterium]|jgi:hypothetical protein